MIEKEFLDRVPLNPGRITLVPVDGMENTFDMKRADNPSVEGTPMNKAAFDSIIQSRLTGRYYVPTVTREIISSREGLTTSPVPLSGWTGENLLPANQKELIFKFSKFTICDFGTNFANPFVRIIICWVMKTGALYEF